MLDAVSRYAERWHFSYNASKSAVVVAGNARYKPKRAAAHHTWTLSGSKLPVSATYTYLGLEFGLLGPGRWAPAIQRLLRAARNRSREVLWANGNHLGLRPKLQVRLWNALCRPLLEYGSVLWGPLIPLELRAELERVQTRFAKAMLGLPVSASGVFARCEAGMRPLESRRDELALRLFGELMLDTSQRLVSQIVRYRWQQARDAQSVQTAHALETAERDSMPGPFALFAPDSPVVGTGPRSSTRARPRPPRGYRYVPGSRSWCNAMRAVFERYDLLHVWEQGLPAGSTVSEWRAQVRRAVASFEEKQLRSDLNTHSTLSLYSELKHKPGLARYLESSVNGEGRRVHCQLRAGVLPLCDRLASVAQLPPDHAARRCRLCAVPCGPITSLPLPGPTSFTVPPFAPDESPTHFLMHCPALQRLRSELMARLLAPSRGGTGTLPPLVQRWFRAASEHDRMRFILDADMHEFAERADSAPPSSPTARLARAILAPSTRATVTRHFHNFLMLAWRLRSKLCGGEPKLNQFAALATASASGADLDPDPAAARSDSDSEFSGVGDSAPSFPLHALARAVRSPMASAELDPLRVGSDPVLSARCRIDDCTPIRRVRCVH